MNLITMIEPEMATSKKTFFSDEHRELDIGVVKTIAATSDLNIWRLLAETSCILFPHLFCNDIC